MRGPGEAKSGRHSRPGRSRGIGTSYSRGRPADFNFSSSTWQVERDNVQSISASRVSFLCSRSRKNDHLPVAQLQASQKRTLLQNIPSRVEPAAKYARTKLRRTFFALGNMSKARTLMAGSRTGIIRNVFSPRKRFSLIHFNKPLQVT